MTGRICGVCKELKGKDVPMQVVHDRLECPECHTSIQDLTKSPVPRWFEEWRVTAEANEPFLRPPFVENGLSDQHLFELYRDAYANVLIGRYNAGVVMLGVLLEATLKEIIYVNEGKRSKGGLGRVLERAEGRGYLREDDVRWLRDFKDRFRNLYQHADFEALLERVYVPVTPFDLDLEDPIRSLDRFEKEVRQGKRRPRLVRATATPSIAAVTKAKLERPLAIRLFNEVHDFLIVAGVRYLSRERYTALAKKVGNPMDKSLPFSAPGLRRVRIGRP